MEFGLYGLHRAERAERRDSNACGETDEVAGRGGASFPSRSDLGSAVQALEAVRHVAETTRSFFFAFSILTMASPDTFRRSFIVEMPQKSSLDV